MVQRSAFRHRAPTHGDRPSICMATASVGNSPRRSVLKAGSGRASQWRASRPSGRTLSHPVHGIASKSLGKGFCHASTSMSCADAAPVAASANTAARMITISTLLLGNQVRWVQMLFQRLQIRDQVIDLIRFKLEPRHLRMPGGDALRESFFKMFHRITPVKVSERGRIGKRAGAGFSNCVTLCAIHLHNCLPAVNREHRLRCAAVNTNEQGGDNCTNATRFYQSLVLSWNGYFDETLIFRLGSFGSVLGIVMCRTPLSNSAAIFSMSTVSGKVIVRAKLP